MLTSYQAAHHEHGLLKIIGWVKVPSLILLLKKPAKITSPSSLPSEAYLRSGSEIGSLAQTMCKTGLHPSLDITMHFFMPVLQEP